MNNIKISVYCLAYNCVNFIDKSINGMLKQKIDVNYKIIIHDDASTDGTADIIRKYAEMYPEKICAILQTENQYSKGVNIYGQYIAPNIEGDYIAICEGDDYWTDENKLQLQYNYMKEHPRCSLCTHNTEIHNLDTNKNRNINSWKSIHVLTAEEVFLQYNVHTSSYFIRKKCKDWPGTAYWFGDLVTLTWAYHRGQVVSLPRVMSVYNSNNPNGVMKSIYSKQTKKIRNETEENYFNEFNVITKYKYDETIQKRYQIKDYSFLIKECDNVILHSPSKMESVNAARKIVSHEYYKKYIDERKGIQRLMTRYRYEGYFFYPLWKFVMRKYLGTRL